MLREGGVLFLFELGRGLDGVSRLVDLMETSDVFYIIWTD